MTTLRTTYIKFNGTIIQVILPASSKEEELAKNLTKDGKLTDKIKALIL